MRVKEVWHLLGESTGNSIIGTRNGMYGGPVAEGAWCVQRTKGSPRGWSQVHTEGLEREAGVTTGPRRPGVRVHFL